eukprot:11688340-Alexandrium_andersonii.AAC.1
MVHCPRNDLTWLAALPTPFIRNDRETHLQRVTPNGHEARQAGGRFRALRTLTRGSEHLGRHHLG